MKTSIYLLFTFLVINLFTNSIVAQMLPLPEAQKLIHQLYEEKILSKEGESEFLKAIKGNEMEIQKTWKEAYHPSFGFQLIAKESDLAPAMKPSQILSLFNMIEQIQDMAEAATYEDFIMKSEVKNPKNIIIGCEKLKGEAWKKHRPERINYESSETAVQQAAAQFQWWAQTLLVIGLLPSELLTDVNEWIEKKRFVNQIMDTPNPLPDFFSFISTRVLYDGLSGVLVKYQMNSIDTLYQIGAINEKNYILLKKSYNSKTAKRSIDFLPFFERAMVLDAKNFESVQNNYEKSYRNFINLVKDSLISDLELNDIHTFSKEFIDNESGETYTNEFLSITLNGIEYHQIVGNIFPEIWSDEGNIDYNIMIGINNDQYISFFQEYLTDRKSAYRMLLVSDKDRIRQKMGTRLGVLLFTSQQLEQIQQLFGFDALGMGSPESYFDYFSFEEIQHFINELKNISILSHLSKTEADAIIPSLRATRRMDFRNILYNLPDVKADLHIFYSEYIEDVDSLPYPFIDLIKKLSKVSGGLFIPTDVQKGWQEYREEDTYPVSTGFKLNGKTYNIEVNSQEENDRFWDEGGIVDFVNQALDDQKIDGKFYSIDYDNFRERNYIFLNKAQYDYLKINYPNILSK